MDISSSSRKNRKNEPVYLPDEILFNILVWLPADFLHHYVRYVCKAWARIISRPNFVRANLQHSKSALVIQMSAAPYNAFSLNLNEEFNVAPLDGPFPNGFVSSSKGLSLFSGVSPHKLLYVGNITTRRLERLPYPIGIKERSLRCHITFVPQTSQYKVVCLSGARKCLVLTLGIDESWRDLDFSSTGVTLYDKVAASVGGVLYLSKGRGAIWGIDLHQETYHSIQVPKEITQKPYWLHELSDSLSCGVNDKGEIHLYTLKGLHCGEWMEKYMLREVIDKSVFLFRTLVPIGWIRNGEVFVFTIRKPGYLKDRYILAYNVKTAATVMYRDDNHEKMHIFTPSLASW